MSKVLKRFLRRIVTLMLAISIVLSSFDVTVFAEDASHEVHEHDSIVETLEEAVLQEGDESRFPGGNGINYAPGKYTPFMSSATFIERLRLAYSIPNIWDNTGNYADKLSDGRVRFDCVRLIKAILWGWVNDYTINYRGGVVEGSNGVPSFGSTTAINYCYDVKRVNNYDYSDIVPGELMSMDIVGHVGIYIGDGKVIESTCDFGGKVVISQISPKGSYTDANGVNLRAHWAWHGKLPWIIYHDHAFNNVGLCACGMDNYTSTREFVTATGTALEKIYIRTSPYEAGTLVTIQNAGSKVSIIGSVTNSFGNQWYIIDHNGNERYVVASKITLANNHAHTYVGGCESAHPHRDYKRCSSCGDTVYTSNGRNISSCSTCNPAPVVVTNSWSVSATEITKSNARLSATINTSSPVVFEKAGIILYDSMWNQIASTEEATTRSTRSTISMWYYPQSDLGLPLNPGQNYYFKCFVYYNGNYYYSHVGSLATPADTTTFSWELSATEVTQTNAKLLGRVRSSAPVVFTQAGIDLYDANWNLLKHFEEATSTTTRSTIDAWYYPIADFGMPLSPGAQYYFRIFVDCNAGRQYSDWGTVTTLPDSTSYNWDLAATNITERSCKLSANCYANTSVVFTSAGVEIWDRQGTPIKWFIEGTTTKPRTNLGIWYDDVAVELGAVLAPGSVYTYRFFVEANGGVHYSPVGAFTTTGVHTHSWNGGVVTRAASCTEQGEKVYTCMTCGGSYTETIAATGHVWGPETIAAMATCENAGTKTRTCASCGMTTSSTYAALGHNWNAGVVTRAATCVEPGEKTYSCDRCNRQRREDIPVAAHKAVELKRISATCVSNGQEAGTKCAVCGVILTEGYVVPALGHSWNAGIITTPATCTSDGVKTFTCTRTGCGHTYTEKIEAAHSLILTAAKQPTATTNGNYAYYTCRACGKVFKDADGIEETTVKAQTYGTIKTYEPYRYCVIGEGADAYIQITGYVAGPSIVTVPSEIAGLPVKEIGKQVFTSNMSSVVEVTIPEGVTSIGSSAFGSNKTIKKVILPSTLKTIGNNAFGGCKVLEEVAIPEGVEIIGSQAFASCENLKIKNLVIPSSVTKIGYGAFSGCPIETVTLPEGITKIHSQSFMLCNKLKSVVIPDTVTEIYQYAFSYCESLENVQFGAGLEVIEPYAFTNCVSLKSIVLPEGITAIGKQAFYHCDALHDIRFPENEINFGESVFAHCEALEEVIVPKKQTVIPKSYLLSVAGLQSVEIPENITEIESGAFQSCSEMKEIIISKNVTKVGENCFKNCNSLETITILSPDIYLSENCFAGLDSLKDIYFVCDENSWRRAVGEKNLGIAENATRTRNARAIMSEKDLGIAKNVTVHYHSALKKVDAEEATCTERGNHEYYKCPVCQSAFSDEEGSAVTYERKELIPIRHEWGKSSVTMAPSCEKEGFEVAFCLLCGEIEYTPIPLLNHSIIVEEAVGPTCTKPGKTEGQYCRYCGKVYVEQTEILPSGHVEVTIEAKDATCTEPGYTKQVECARCGKVFNASQPIEATGHDIDESTWVHDEENHWKQCKKCGAAFEFTAHSGGIATTENLAICDICSCPYGELKVEEENVDDVAKIFTDVSRNIWYYEYVQYVYDKGLMTGTTTTTFAPLATLGRAQFATIIWRMEGSPKVKFSKKFKDVSEGAWFSDAVMWASEAGIITGYTSGARAGCFAPADSANREQMAVMMHRYAKYKGYDTSKTASFSSFVDAKKVSSYATEAMQWVIGNGIISGKYEGTTLDPQGKTSRAEASAIIARFDKAFVK